MASDHSTHPHVRLQVPTPCPQCRGERIVYDDPHNVAPVLVCIECTPWMPTSEFAELERSVRVARIRRAM